MSGLQKIKIFLGEVKGELKRTTWPSRKEVWGTTTVVIATVFVFAVFLFVVDMALSRLIDLVFDLAG